VRRSAQADEHVTARPRRARTRYAPFLDSPADRHAPGLLWQTGRGGRRILGRAGAALGTPAIAPVSVDLLRDPAWRLRLLPGIGTGRAWEIVRDRERAPPYRRLEDLRRVRGIGPRTIERIGGTSALRVLLDGRPVGWAHDTAARSPGDA